MDQVLALLRALKKDPAITAATPLIATGVLESVDMMHLITSLEEHFAIEILGEDIIPENFTDAAAIAAMVRRNGGRL